MLGLSFLGSVGLGFRIGEVWAGGRGGGGGFKSRTL